MQMISSTLRKEVLRRPVDEFHPEAIYLFGSQFHTVMSHRRKWLHLGAAIVLTATLFFVMAFVWKRVRAAQSILCPRPHLHFDF